MLGFLNIGENNMMATILNFKREHQNIDPTAGEKALDRLAALVAEDMAAVNQIILQQTESRVSLAPELAGHIIGAGGKRLRPVLTLACAKLCDYEGSRHHKLSASIEFIHTASLLHDDVVDGSDLRRGAPSANALFGNQASVLVGDYLISRAFQLIVEDGAPAILRIFAETSLILAEGEIMQLSSIKNTSTSEQTYLDIVRAKTAELFAAACQIAGVVAERAPGEIEALRTFGLNLGIAYQIVDDVLDYTADRRQFGKAVGDDFREGKVTLPVILAMSRGNDAERAFWRRTCDERRQSGNDFAEAQQLLSRHDALQDSLERARHYATIASDALGLFSDSPVKQVLLDSVEFTVQRGF
jgi:octaprenyl-diphosphate synthase